MSDDNFSATIPYDEPDIRLCAQNTTKIADLFKFMQTANEGYMREVEHTREVLSKDILLNRELMSKDLQSLCSSMSGELSRVKTSQEDMKVQMKLQEESIDNLAKIVHKHYKTVTGWALWLAGSIAVSSLLMALNLLTRAR